MNQIDKQYELILSRRDHPETGSYTNYLFDKGLEKILKKVGEESTEVIIAALSQNKEDLVGELNDLIYHLQVLMVDKGITPEDIDEELARRSEHQHNLKPERKPVTEI